MTVFRSWFESAREEARGWVTKLPNGVVCYSFVGDAPKTILAQLRTHQRKPVLELALSSQSSRAVPISFMESKVPTFVPDFRSGSTGMDSGKEHSPEVQTKLRALWVAHEQYTLETIKEMLNVAPSLSKGQINRLLEPHRLTKVVMTAPLSIWEGFWKLRLAHSAQDEMQEFAQMTKDVYEKTEAVEADVHVPFEVSRPEEAIVLAARTSYRREHLKDADKLFQRLVEEKHMGPFECVLFPTPSPLVGQYQLEGRFVGHGVYPYRALVDEDMKSPKDLLASKSGLASLN